MKTLIFIILSTTCMYGHGQTYKSVTVYDNKKSTPLQSVIDTGYIQIDTIKGTISIESIKDGVLIQGHSMKRLSANNYRFHKYNRENTDFELEVYPDSMVLHTQLAFWAKGFKYKTVFVMR